MGERKITRSRSQPPGRPGLCPLLLGTEMGEQYRTQTASCCCPLHSLACLSPPKSTLITSEPHALLCLCLGPRGGQRGQAHGPSLSPALPCLLPKRHTKHSEQGTPTSLYLSRGLTYGEKALQPCSPAPAFGQERTRIPPFILKTAKKKRLYCLQLPSQPLAQAPRALRRPLETPTPSP